MYSGPLRKKCSNTRSNSPAFRLNTESYSVSLRIQSECGKIRTRKNSVFGHFSRSERFSKISLFLQKETNL